MKSKVARREGAAGVAFNGKSSQGEGGGYGKWLSCHCLGGAAQLDDRTGGRHVVWRVSLNDWVGADDGWQTPVRHCRWPWPIGLPGWAGNRRRSILLASVNGVEYHVRKHRSAY